MASTQNPKYLYPNVNVPIQAVKVLAKELGEQEDKVYVIWSAKTLKNWKAVLGVVGHYDRIFEVTRNGESNEIYIDKYVKYNNVVIKEEEQ